MKQKNKLTFQRYFLLKSHDVLSYFKTYKLIYELVVANKISKFQNNEPWDYRKDPKVLSAVSISDEVFRRSLIVTEENRTKVEMAKQTLLQALKKTKGECDLYLHLAHIYYYFDRNYEQAIAYYIKSFTMTTDDDLTNTSRGEYLIQLLNDPLVPDSSKKKILDFRGQSLKEETDIAASFLSISRREIHDWIEADIQKIIQTILTYNIKLIVMNYSPMLSQEEDVELNALIRRLAFSTNVSFVDNEMIFKTLFSQGEKERDYHYSLNGIYDDHLNAKGYGVVAQNVLSVIQTDHLIP